MNVCVTTTDIINDFSTYNRLIRITSLCKRFRQSCLHSPNHVTGRLTTEELQSNRRFWILQTQLQHNYDELLCLGKSIPEPISNKSRLLSLTPFVDGSGLLRIRGRLENSMLPYDEVHPIILPPKAQFTGLVIDRAHLRNMHFYIRASTIVVRSKSGHQRAEASRHTRAVWQSLCASR